MTGWRIGYSAAPDELASAFSNLQDQVTSSPTSFAQAGAIQALCLESSEIEKMRTEFQERRDLVVGLLRAIPGIEVTKPEGAFYVLPSINNYLGGRIQTDGELAAYLLENAQTAVIPGEVFEAQGHLRISYAASRDDIRRGIGRIADALGKIGI